MHRLAILLAVAFAASASNAVIVRPAANMHSGPDIDKDVVSQAIFGTTVQILESIPMWKRIRTEDQYTGWVEDGALIVSESRYPNTSTVAVVTSLFANLYRGPSIIRHKPIFSVPFETQLELAGKDEKQPERWWKVRLPDGGEAWVQAGDVTLSYAKMSVTEMLALSRQFLGLPYLWGGNSTYGYDCSGFTQMLYRRMGVVLPRDAHLQAAWSGVVPVAKDALMPGDLLFFGADSKITHTGIYLGAGEFIHATAHQRPVIQISRIDDPHWAELLTATRRLK